MFATLFSLYDYNRRLPLDMTSHYIIIIPKWQSSLISIRWPDAHLSMIDS